VTGWLGGRHLAPLTGVASLVLGLAGLIVLEGPADRPETDQPPAVILEYFRDSNTVILGSFLMMLAAVAFVWFAGTLRARLQDAEGPGGSLATVAFGGGLAAAVFMLAMPATNVGGVLFADELRPPAAQTFYLFGDAFLYPATLAAAICVGATAIVALRTGMLPAWLAWPSAFLALWLLVPPIGSSAGTPENPAVWTGLAALPGVLVWAAITAIVLFRAKE
jgi:hypothetical protein